MAKNKISKDDLKSPDAFMSLADRVGQTLSDHWKPIAAFCGLLLALGIGNTALNAMNRAKEADASEALFEVEKQINEVRNNYSKKQQESVKDLLDKSDENQAKIEARLKDLAPLDYEKDFSQPASQLEQVIGKHSDTQNAQMARIRLARLYIDYDQLDKAENILRPATLESSKGSSLYGLSRTLLASVMSHKGQLQESIQLLSEVLDDQKLTYLHSEVLLKLGVLNKESGNTGRAEEMFRRVTTEFGNTEAGKTAKNYLKMIRYISPAPEAESKASTVDL